jgi:hypothetical protein
MANTLGRHAIILTEHNVDDAALVSRHCAQPNRLMPLNGLVCLLLRH